MEKTNFEKLEVYRLAEKLADEIWAIVLTWDFFARDTVGKQLVKAVDGVPANIAEGTGRGSLPDNRRFIRIARGSLYETKNWLRRSFRRNLLTKRQVERVKPLISELLPKLNAYYRSVDFAANREPFEGKATTTNKAQSTKSKVQRA